MSSNQKKKLKYKELTLNVLILIDIIAITYISFYPSSPVLIYSINIFDFLLCVILFIEFLYNIRMEKDKWVFIKENWTDILAFIPIYYFRIFRFTRLIRLLRLLKILALFRKYLKGLFKFLLETHMDQRLGYSYSPCSAAHSYSTAQNGVLIHLSRALQIPSGTP